MGAIKGAALMIFSIGVAIMAKYWGFYPWVADNAWIGLPMAAIGAIGVVFLFGNEEL